MSYILDALRKSDQQRQLGAAPTLRMGQATEAAPQRPAYLYYGLLAAILLGAGVAIGWLRPWQAQAERSLPATSVVAAKPAEASARQSEPARTEVAPEPRAQTVNPAAQIAPAPAPGASRDAVTATAIAPVAAPAPRPAAVAVPAPVPASAPATPLIRTPATVKAPVQLPPPAPAKSHAPALAPAKSQSLTSAKAEVPGKAQEGLAAVPAKGGQPEPAQAATATAPAQNIIWLAELPLALQQELPPMTISVHAFSARPGDRMVGINDRMLREGEYVVPGLKLEQITPEGMVFGYKGYSFRRGVK